MITTGGNIVELGQTSGVAIRTDDSGSPAGRMWLEYCNGQVLKVFLNNQGDVKPLQPQLSVAVDLKELFTGEDIVIGYSAGTWSLADNQDIMSWVFRQTCGI